MLDPAECAAVVLAGGHSRRMGRDKASLPHPAGGTLLSHQLAQFTLAGYPRRLVSARPGQALPPLPADVTRVDDDGTSGPLGGLVAALRACPEPFLLVVAVDLPHVTSDDLRWLRAQAGPKGVVPRSAHGPEPLCAIYPRSWLPTAELALTSGQLSLRALLSTAESAAHFDFCPWTGPAATWLNWNTPADLRANPAVQA